MKKRSVKLNPPCRCGSTGATWKGLGLYCSNSKCDQLVRERGKDRIPASLPYDRYPIASKVLPSDGVKYTHKVFDAELAKKLFDKFGCGNGQICDDDSCPLC